MANRDVFKLDQHASLLTSPRLLTAFRFLGDVATSRANISAHYDIGNTMSVLTLRPPSLI